MKKLIYIGSAVIVLLLAGGGYLGYTYIQLKDAHQATLGELSSTKDALAAVQGENSDLATNLSSLRADNKMLSEALDNEKSRNDAFQEQIDTLSSTVGKLDTLSKTDPELLKKYSKVYFLNENYVPAKLSQLDKKYLFDPEKPAFILSKVEPFLTDMLDAAHDDGVSLLIDSAYRSFDEQTALKGEYLTTYGTGANTFSADQGYSEHQLGTAVDFTTESQNGQLDGFEKTDAYTWLQKNAYKYGFTLSYPENNEYYVFEPWHWRFVGRDLAKFLQRNDDYFYNLDQRKIDEYLISLFD